MSILEIKLILQSQKKLKNVRKNYSFDAGLKDLGICKKFVEKNQQKKLVCATRRYTS